MGVQQRFSPKDNSLYSTKVANHKSSGGELPQTLIKRIFLFITVAKIPQVHIAERITCLGAGFDGQICLCPLALQLHI
jgi:hypothetical protein